MVADPGAIRAQVGRRAPVVLHRLAGVGLAGSVVASCITPYGPGLLAYDFAVSRNGQISRYITEWNSPNFHSVLTLLVFCVSLGVLVACIWTRRIPLLEGSLGLFLFVEALRTERLVTYLMVVAAGLAATLPAGPPGGPRRAAGRGEGCWPWRSSSSPFPRSRPGRCRRRSRSEPSTTSVRALVGYSRNTPGATIRWRATVPLRRWAHGPLRGPGAHRVHGGDEPDQEPRPRALGLPRLLCGLGPPYGACAVPRPRPTLAGRGPDVGGPGLRPPLRGRARGQPYCAWRPRRSPSSSDQVRMEAYPSLSSVGRSTSA